MSLRRVRDACLVVGLGAALACTATQPAAAETETKADADKRGALERLSQAEDRWYRVAWGKERSADERAAGARRFDCVWAELRKHDVDPLPDLECLERAMTAVAECQSAGKPVRECTGAFERACTFSPAYLDSAKVCKLDAR